MEDVIAVLEQAREAGKISQEAHDNVVSWLQNEQLSDYHQEIQELVQATNWQALNDAFFTQIEFGTAGIRGRTGLGSARINSWTVGTAAQGLADYVKAQGEDAVKRGVIIGSDTRITSPEFVQLVSDVLTTNGIKVFQFERPPQVGMFSFAVRLYKAQAGIYISASHNPPTDNGIKIYWEDGAQVLPPHDKGVTEAVKQVVIVQKDGPKPELIELIGDAFDSDYRARILHESVYHGRSAKVVYSPFHGTGQYGVLPVLQEAGFEVITVDEQMEPSGHFPNVPGGVPNPQNRESNQLTMEKVLSTGADIGISTDPDADRLGLVIPKDDSAVILDGNETASLLAYFICQQLKNDEKLPANGFLVRTTVTTPLVDAIAEDFQLKCYHAFVGFKFIGEIITKHEDFGDELFIYGGEESFGSLKGSYARDKDASSVALIAAEMVSWLKDNKKTVWDLFDEMYERYGYYLNHLVNLRFEGSEGFAKMTKLMQELRTNPPKQLGEWPVVTTTDYKAKDLNGHHTNMLVFDLSEDGKNQVTIRPSGTEPQIKVYLALTMPYDQIETAKTKAADFEAAIHQFVDQLTSKQE